MRRGPKRETDWKAAKETGWGCSHCIRSDKKKASNEVKKKKAGAVVGKNEEGKGRLISKKQTKIIKRQVGTRYNEMNQNCLMMERIGWGQKRSNEV